MRRLFWNTEEHRLRLLWRLIAALLLAGLLLIPISIVASLLLLVLVPGRLGLTLEQLLATAPEQMLGLLMADPLTAAVAGLLPLALVLLALVATAALVDRRPLATYGLRLGRRWWADLAFGLLLGALLMALVFLLQWAAGWVEVGGPAAPPSAVTRTLLGALITFVGVGIYEELLLRGWLLKNLAEGLNLPKVTARGAIVLAWLLSSVVFGLLHATNPNATLVSTANLVLAGLFLGLGYLLTGELAIPIGLHITWNYFQGAVFGLPVSGMATAAPLIETRAVGPELWTGGAFGPEAGLVGLLALLLGSAAILLYVRRRQGAAELDERLAVYVPRRGPGEADLP